MSDAVRVSGLTKHFGDVRALDGVDLAIRADAITGLLGRNGAGKTTLMQILTGQLFPDAGRIELFGHSPAENDAVLRHVCFVKESQVYPDMFRVQDVLSAAALLHPAWDQALADDLLRAFDLPTDRRVPKLSRGMRSAMGVVVGLASRAPLSFFDEPYVGLDAVARQVFYDRLVADVAEHPRTVVLSTHLIDEVADLVEHVVLVDHGRVLLDEDAEALRGRALTVSGPTDRVDEFVAGREVLHREHLAGSTRLTLGDVSPDDRASALAAGLVLDPVSLQQLVVRTTTSTGADR